MHRLRMNRNALSGNAEPIGVRTAAWALEQYSDHVREKRRLRPLVSSGYLLDDERRSQLVECAPRHSAVFVGAVRAADDVTQSRAACFDTVLVDLANEPDWALAVFRAWLLLEPGGRLIALAPRSPSHGEFAQPAGTLRLLSLLCHRGRPPRRTRRAGIAKDVDVPWCTKPGSRAATLQRRAMWGEP